jgi:bifunctional enzyme Fae/Hps
MRRDATTKLDKKKRYLQVAFNSTLEDARGIIDILPPSDRILVEAGTPLIKRYGMDAVRTLHAWWTARLLAGGASPLPKKDEALKSFGLLGMAISHLAKQQSLHIAETTFPTEIGSAIPYVVADMKTMDRGDAEVAMAADAGASGVVALGSAPIETLDIFVASCEASGVDAMIDMMNVEFPLATLRALRRQPRVVILHRGVDEERDNKQKMLPLHEIRRIKGAHDMIIAVAGGDTPREIQSAAFNDADIVVIWKSVFERNEKTLDTVESFLKSIK